MAELTDDKAKRMTAARAELRDAVAQFDLMSGTVAVVRLTNAIEDMIDARISALTALISQETTNGN